MKLPHVIPALILLSLIVILSMWDKESRSDASTHREAPSVNQPAERTQAPASIEEPTETLRLPNPEKIRDAIEQGSPLQLSLENEAIRTLSFRPRPLLDDSFALRLGMNNDLEISVAAYEGRAFTPKRGIQNASVVIIGPMISGVIDELNGDTLSFTFNVDNGDLNAFRQEAEPTQCTLNSSGSIAHITTARLSPAQPTPVALSLTPTSEAQGGVNPATGNMDLFADPIPLSEAYEASLKPLLLVMVLDKSATGSGDATNLAAQSSRHLASISHVAANYENQLGMRLLVQELILIPDEPDFDDVPVGADVLASFRQWMAQFRPIGEYQWSVASKWGAGLTGSTLGLAYVRTIESSASLCIQRPSTNWFTLAHEVGHALGSDHSDGGIMNSVADETNAATFFTDVNANDTAALQIYDYSGDRLQGIANLRNPGEIPFAEPDFRAIHVNTSIAFDPRENDLPGVRKGLANAYVSVEDISRITPPGAGEVSLIDDHIHFTPATDFEGVVWFSYSLRGSLGNDGNGWLHKGDVAILVGNPDHDPFELSLAPGQTHLLELPRGTLSLTQPTQAQIDRSLDDSQLLIIRVDANAEGVDEFEAAGQHYDITYASNPLETRPDWYLHHPGEGELRFFPLSNDYGTGYRWLHPISTSIGTLSESSESYFPTTLTLLDAENDSPNLGELTVVRLPVNIDGNSVNRPTGELRFRANNDASGVARVRYTVQDAKGEVREETASIRFGGSAIPFVSEGHSMRYEVPEDVSSVGSNWMQTNYTDTTWRSGPLGIGYEAGSGYATAINTDVQSLMENRRSTVYMRIPFHLVAVPQLEALSLKVRYDDGFVAYLNGQEILRRHAPNTLNWTSSATESNEADLEHPEVFDVSHALPWLTKGKNVLAVQGLNVRTQSSDFLFDAELTGLNREYLASLVTPAFRPIEIPPGTGILLHARTHELPGEPFSGDTQVEWQITSAPPGASLSRSIARSPLQGAYHFTTPGTYRVQLIGKDDSVQTAQSFSIKVGEPYTNTLVGPLVDAGADQAVLQNSLTLIGSVAHVVPQSSPSLQWQQISGPAESAFSNPTLIETEVVLPQAGSYRFRLTANQSGFLQTFDDVEVQWNVLDQSLIDVSSPSRYLIPSASQDPTEWTSPIFDDSSWMQSGNALGFDFGTTLSDVIVSDLSGTFFNKGSSLYTRFPFTLEVASQVESLSFRIRANDGYVAYLNGSEIARSNAPLYGLSGESSANRSIANSEGLIYHSQSLTHALPILRNGVNILAVHGLNDSASNSDFFLDVRLTGTLAIDERSPSVAILSLPPIAIEPRSATFVTELSEAGISDSTSLIYYWGRSDGGTLPNMWEFESELTDLLSSGRREDRNDGLYPGTHWYYRAALRTEEELRWAPETISFDTPPEFSPAYDLWMNEFQLTVVELRSPLADPDGDGLNNLTEFALDLIPTISNQKRTTLQARRVDEGEIEITYERRRQPELSSLLFTVEASDDLQENSWQTVDADITWAQPLSVTKERVSMLLPATAARAYFRLRIELLTEP